MKMKLTSAIVASLLGGLSLAANAATIDFTADTAEAKANGFTSTGHPLVSFTDTVGTGLQIANFGVQSIGNGLAVNSDNDASKLQINFGAAMNYLSLDFGNDDALYTIAGDRAWLELFNGATSVGVFSVVLNGNDIMDQTIVGTAGSFDSALFWYGDAAGGPNTGGGQVRVGLTEVVDNIEYRQATGTPDAGSTLALSVFALMGLVAARRKLLV